MNTIAPIATLITQPRNVCNVVTSCERNAVEAPRRSSALLDAPRFLSESLSATIPTTALKCPKMLQASLGLERWTCYRSIVLGIRSLDQPRSPGITHWTTKAMSMLTDTQHGLYLGYSTTHYHSPCQIAQKILFLGKKQHISCFGCQNSIFEEIATISAPQLHAIHQRSIQARTTFFTFSSQRTTIT